MPEIEIKRIDSSIEKLILTRLIISKKYCEHVIPIIEPELLSSSASTTIAQWVIDYFKKYKTPPARNIQSIYEEKEKELIEEDSEIVSNILSHISEEYEEEEHFNEDYAIDQSIKYLKECKLKRLKQEIEGAISAGRADEAEQAVKNYSKLYKFEYQHIDVLGDRKALIEALNDESERLFSFPGDLGEMLGAFQVGDLIAFMGPAKRGKTFWLIECAIRSVISGYNTLMFSFEMTRNQILRRFYQNFCAAVSLNSRDDLVDYPFFSMNQDGKYDVCASHKSIPRLNTRIAARKLRGMQKMSRAGRLKLVSAPSKSMSVSDIDDYSDKLLNDEGFVPSVILADYADITLPDPGSGKDHRHQIDNVWTGYKSLALKKHCLVITATHSNRQTFHRDSTESDVTEDIRKINHVSMMIGLNQKKEEKKRNVMRLVALACRHDEFSTDEEVVVLQNFKIGKAYIDSKWVHRVELEKEEEGKKKDDT